MTTTSRPPGGRRMLLGLLALTLLIPLGSTRAAGELDKIGGSLQLVPADAAFYSTSLGLGEQWDALQRTRAWAKLRDLPVVQLGLTALNEQLKQPQAAQALEMLRQPENQELLALLNDLWRREIFVFGGATTNDFFELLGEVYGGAYYGPQLAKLLGEDAGTNPDTIRIRIALETLAQNIDRLKMPELVLGFRLSKPDRAGNQLTRLEKLLKRNLEKTPLKGQLRRSKVGESSFLTLTLDARLLPWDKISFKEYENEAGQFDELRKKLQKLKLTINLGVRGDYLLLSVEESPASLERLGQGATLASRPELKPLARFADKPISDINYVSQAFNVRRTTSASDIDSARGWVTELMKKAPITDEQRKKIELDLDAMALEVKGALPKPGALLSFSFTTERGAESYSYDWTQPTDRDGSKSLTLLQHLGGSPIAAVVGRSKYQPERYRTLTKWIKVIYGHLKETVVPQLPEEQQQAFTLVKNLVEPLAVQLDKATGELLLPALKDGQMGFVLDARWRSKQWVSVLPETPKAMPMLEVGLLYGVSDAEMLRQAGTEYRLAVNKLVESLPFIGGWAVPEPESKEIAGGTAYYYPLPPMRLDEHILPNAALGKNVLALTLSTAHSERLLKRTPLQVDGGPLNNVKRPLAGAALFNGPAFLEALTPWIEMGVNLAVERLAQEEKLDEKTRASILPQVKTVLEVLKTFRGYQSVTFFEDAAQVTHGESVFKDL